jgi:hypothetical protein
MLRTNYVGDDVIAEDVKQTSLGEPLADITEDEASMLREIGAAKRAADYTLQIALADHRMAINVISQRETAWWAAVTSRLPDLVVVGKRLMADSDKMKIFEAAT